MKKIKEVFMIALFFNLLFLTAEAQTKAENSQIIALDNAVVKGELPNGFTYYIRRNTEPKNRVYMYLVNKVGSILEEEQERGLAHFMEHMNFNGTTHFPKNELVNYLQHAGVKFGADLNAYTSFDETVYQLPLPADNPEIIKNGYQIMRDWAQEATLDPKEIDQERGVILEERRLGKDAQQRMRDQYFPLLLNGSRYAERLPIGTEEVLKNFSPEVIRKFYKDWYRPNLQALIVVGDIDVKETEQSIRAKFSDLKNPPNERERTSYGVVLNGENHFQVVTDREMPSISIQILMKRRAKEIKTEADYRNSIVMSLFNQMMGKRMAALSRQANPPFVFASLGMGGFIADLDVFSGMVNARPGEIETGFKAVWREAERLKKYGFNHSELDRVKKAYLARMATSYGERNKTSSVQYINEYQRHFLKGEAAPGIEKEYELVQMLLPEITLEDLNSLGAQSIQENDRDILILAPEKDKDQLPNEQMVMNWIAEVRKESLLPFVDEASDRPLLANKPVRGKIVKETYHKKLDLTTLTLNNGVKVMLKPTAFKDNEIRFTAISSGGTSLYSDSDYQSAANAGGIIGAGGVGDFNSLRLSNQLAGKSLSVTPFISERNEGINGSSTPADLETALQLSHLYFTRPRKDTVVFQSIISRSRPGLLNRHADPKNVFADTISAVLGNYNIRRTGPTIQKLEQVNLDDAYRIYKERFADASGFTFTFVGNFKVEEIKPLLEEYLGSLPSLSKKEEARNLNLQTPSGIIKKTVYKGSEVRATVRLILSGKYQFSAQENLVMDALSQVLEIRLLERLREEESGVYTPQSSVGYVKYPDPRFALNISFGCAPENVDRLIASAMDEVKKLREEGPSQVNLDKFKAERLRGQELQLQNNGFWLSYINGQLQKKENLEQVFKTQENLEKVNLEMVRKAAAKYLSGKNFIQFVLLPEE